jgi:hypothetical protein
LGFLLDAYAKTSSSTAPKLGVVGVTHTGLGRMNYLKGVREEVRKITSIIKEAQIECLEGERATVAAVK